MTQDRNRTSALWPDTREQDQERGAPSHKNHNIEAVSSTINKLSIEAAASTREDGQLSNGTRGKSPEAENSSGKVGLTDTSDHQFEAQEGWLYMGHGEWTQLDNTEQASEHGNKLSEYLK